MANYRPRSLDELGNLYDKSLEAENEIKKSSSKLEDKPADAQSAFLPEENMIPAKKTPEQLAADEIADRIGDFAKSFGEDSVKHQPPVFIPTVQSRPKPPKRRPVEGEKKPAPAAPKLIRNSERTSLFENYKKVMDDEDDDISAEEEMPKRRLWRSKSSAPDAQQNQQNQEDAALMAEKAVAETFGTQGEKPQQPELSFKKISYQEYKGDSEKVTEEQTEDTKEKKSTGLQVFLMSLLLLVLMLATLVGCVKAFSGLNSDKPLFGEYQLYTSKRSYSEFNIGKSDLIVVQNEALVQGDIIAYKENEGSYSLAKYEDALNEESVVAVKGGEQIPVFYNDMRGVVTKTVPVLGLLVSVCVSYFLPVMGLMLLLAALLILLVFFTTRSPQQEDDQDEELPEENVPEAETDEEEGNEADEIDDEIESLFNV